MAALHNTNIANVRASVNQWLKTELAAITKPSYLPSYNIVFTIPEEGISPPAFGCFHMDALMTPGWMGDRASATEYGARQHSLLDVSIYTSRASRHWLPQHNFMNAMVAEIFLGVPSIAISDYVTDPSNPSTTSYKVNFDNVDKVETQPEPNPDLMRSRYLVSYQWTIRSSI